MTKASRAVRDMFTTSHLRKSVSSVPLSRLFPQLSYPAPLTLRASLRKMSTAATSRRPIRLILDFDGTITTSDTLAPLSRIGYNHASHQSPPRTLTPWSNIVDAYLSDYSQHAASYTPTAERRTTPTEEAAWLNSLEPIERASARRAIDAGIWDGVSREEVEAAAGREMRKGNVRLRRGCKELTEWAVRGSEQHGETGNGMEVSVVSVNWSRHWIWSVLKNGLDSSDDGEVAAEMLKKVPIFANELPSIATLPAGDIAGASTELRTSGDKLRCMQQQKSGQGSEMNPPFVVYLGDSTTDLECLAEADLGVCIRDEKIGSSQKELAAVLERLKMDVRWIGEEKRYIEEDRKTIVWAKDFEVVKVWLSRYLRA